MVKPYMAYTNSKISEFIQPAEASERDARSKLITDLGPGAGALLDPTMGDVARTQLLKSMATDKVFSSAPDARRLNFDDSVSPSFEESSTSYVKKKLSEHSSNDTFRLPKGPTF